MADEIVELRRRVIGEDSNGDDLVSFEVLFLYPVDPPITITPADGGDPIVYPPTPRSTLPDGVVTYQLLTPSELAELDAGTMAFKQKTIEQLDGQTLAQVRSVAIAAWARVGTKMLSDLRTELANAGRRHSVR